MKEEIFSKFKDYNKELEKILEKKDFSKDTKNLLLSMFYKLDISYNDYSKVKRNTKTKAEYLENNFIKYLSFKFYSLSCGGCIIFNSSHLSLLINTFLGLLPWYPEIIPRSSI